MGGACLLLCCHLIGVLRLLDRVGLEQVTDHVAQRVAKTRWP